VASVSARGPATIVVVEEKAAVQELVEQALREAGHRVLVTNDPLEALEVGRRVRIDLLVTGVHLEQRGPTLVGRLRSIQADLRVLYLADPDDDRRELDESVTLCSPFSLDQLQQAVAYALDSD
jgi:DNA-binding response OmpR family regulator